MLIQVEEFGEPDGMPVPVHLGSPGSPRLFRPGAELAVPEFGLRLLSCDRLGYGGRPRYPGRRTADAATDVRYIVGALGIGRLGLWGFSGGGAYALACAALLPDLVAGAAVFASFAPYRSPGLDFCEGGPPEHRWGTAAGTDDAQIQEVASHFAAGIRDALTCGDAGWWDDWTATLRPWDCDLSAIRIPVRLSGIVAHLPESEDHTNIEHNNRQAAYAWLSRLT